MSDALPAAHPGETDLQRGWRLGVAAARETVVRLPAIEHEPGSYGSYELFRAAGRTDARFAIQALANAGPPADLGAPR